MSIQESGHWYDVKGLPCHTQKCGPRAKNPTRQTTIRDARRLGLFPSVTSILGILAKPQLERWKFRQITDAAYSHARNVSEDIFFSSVVEKAFEQVGKAADAGSAIHNILEDISNGKEWSKDSLIELPDFGDVRADVVIQPVVDWFDKNIKKVIGVERRLVNTSVGFAGMADLLVELKDGRVACIDFKTRKTTQGKECTPYEGQPMQIAAYARTAFGEELDIAGCNLYISTTEPGRISESWYDADRLNTEFDAFCHVVEAWKHIKGHNPIKQQ